MMQNEYSVRKAFPEEFERVGKMMHHVYTLLDGFPTEAEQPEYYRMLLQIDELTKKPCTELWVAVSPEGNIGGAVVYISDMKYYGSGGMATSETNASGFRILAVDPAFRGKGIGKLLTLECLRKARENYHSQVIIHSTKAMNLAWQMYEKIGFKRSEDLDFMQGELPVYGFRLPL